MMDEAPTPLTDAERAEMTKLVKIGVRPGGAQLRPLKEAR